MEPGCKDGRKPAGQEGMGDTQAVDRVELGSVSFGAWQHHS